MAERVDKLEEKLEGLSDLVVRRLDEIIQVSKPIGANNTRTTPGGTRDHRVRPIAQGRP